MKPHIAITTCQEQPIISSDDALFIKSLKTLSPNLAVTITPWDQKQINWSDFDLILPRACWDYHEKFTLFTDWLSHLQNINASIWNPTRLLKWNSHKFYLDELGKKGVKILPTLFSSQQNPYDIADGFDFYNTDQLVFKPAVSAGARNTWVLDKNNLKNHSALETHLKNNDFLIQPYSQHLVTHGEFSFIFFNEKLSHVIRKTPKKGDFRSQPKFGSLITEETNVSEAVHAQIIDILAHIPENWLYARVDGIIKNNVFQLVELELIEPCLFMDIPISPTHQIFAQAVLEKL